MQFKKGFKNFFTGAKNIFIVFKTAFKGWWAKDPFKESAVIAYYSIFSLPGLMVVIVTIAGYAFGEEAVRGQIAAQITSILSVDTAHQVQDIIAKATESKKSVWAAIIGIITIVVGATGVFAQFQKSLNIIWEVKADETKSGILNLLKVRLFSFGLIVAIAFILIASLVVSAMLSAFGDWITNYFQDSILVIVQIINFVFSFAVMAILFALMFKIFPDAKIKWRHVWVGSLVTAFLFDIGKSVLGLYFGKVDPGSGYGAAGSIVLIMLWVSYSSMIVFYGAEFTHAYAEMKDGKIAPDENAVKDENRKI